MCLSCDLIVKPSFSEAFHLEENGKDDFDLEFSDDVRAIFDFSYCNNITYRSSSEMPIFSTGQMPRPQPPPKILVSPQVWL